MDFGKMDKRKLLSRETIMKILDIGDGFERSDVLSDAKLRAAELGVKGLLCEKIKSYIKEAEEAKKEEEKKKSAQARKPGENYTQFVGETDENGREKYPNMFCGSWIANESGVYAQNASQVTSIACYHPILPVERMKNLETGEEKIKIAFKRGDRWETAIVPKTTVTSASKIVALSGRGVAVTSENAKLLVKFLSDVENQNSGMIGVKYSSSKLGWNGGDFLPYDTRISFDGDSRFAQLSDSLGERGSRERWYGHVRGLRRSGRMEVKLMLAASFASVIVHLVGGLPFFIDLWGETEGGKTVTLMLAASVWANPAESAYIGDFKTTDVALEAKANLLNSLPMILDDTSKKNRKIEDNFEGVVYDLCSGKGKTRSNREIGINTENRWSNCILTNGERPLTAYVSQGGAINRILEVECGERVYADPRETAETLKRNYGFAGRDFVSAVKAMGFEAVREMQREFMRLLSDDEKMQKQSLSLSIILTADRIATEALFKDGQYISIDEAKKVLVDRNELSEGERCYRFIMDKAAMNATRFDTDTNCEKWGALKLVKETGERFVAFYPQALDELCMAGGFSKSSFLSWAKKKKAVLLQSGKFTRPTRINGALVRCTWVRVEDVSEFGTDRNGFIQVDGSMQEELPFD